MQPLAHSRLTTHDSRLTTHDSPLTARRARLHSSSLLIVQQVAVDLVDETTTSELGRVMSITTKQFTTDKHHAASASRQHWCMWIERQVAPDVQHTKQVAGKLTTSSCSSAAAGEKAARSTCEPTSSHSALRATGRARQPPSRTRAKLNLCALARNLIYLSISISRSAASKSYDPRFARGSWIRELADI